MACGCGGGNGGQGGCGGQKPVSEATETPAVQEVVPEPAQEAEAQETEPGSEQ
ncbi:hypothetical protein SAMN05216186_11423 [Pseudomonas indica]|uniref:Uncharacterized protein n=1 Tax=Pseudomonas indica TaxID=137658 RepID=A0A1G9GWV4_9PSED|nr:hypothetical protein SAMN05216186_11423 [Pseudomonas indica]